MKSLTCTVILLAILSTVSYAAQKVDSAEEAHRIEGVWITKSDDLIRIYSKDNKFEGMPQAKEGQEERKDDKNPDENLRGRLLSKTVILENFTYKGNNQWGSGMIYDPNNGKTYNCIITMKSGSELLVRGFIGISLFGRTESWKRLE